eukprot:gene33306-40291_t
MGVKRKPASQTPSGSGGKKAPRRSDARSSIGSQAEDNEDLDASQQSQSIKGPEEKYASRKIKAILDEAIDSEVQRAKNPELTRQVLGKLRSKICKQVSEGSVVLFQKEDETPEALKASIAELEGRIRNDILAWREQSLQGLRGTGKNASKNIKLSSPELDTSMIDSKAQEICAKFHQISHEVNAVLGSAEERVHRFEETLQAVKTSLQTSESSTSSQLRA